jgi:hypothetical protein
LSIYRVHFKWKEKELNLKAKSLDLTHPYFVSIKGIIFPEEKKLIIDPSEDEVRKFFGEADHLMIPFQTVSLIEELPDDPPPDFGKNKVMPFSIVEEKQSGKGSPKKKKRTDTQE